MKIKNDISISYNYSTNYMNQNNDVAAYNGFIISPYLDMFKSIGLDEMNKAAFMKRVDHKFIMRREQLDDILPKLSKTFYILEINKSVNQNYSSVYYDTPELDMYFKHHNKRTNRYKIRQRMYNSSGDSFLEIKHKNNKGVTRKLRVESMERFEIIPYKYHEFILNNSPYFPLELQKVMENNFFRFTLTNKQRSQRITIDTNILFCEGDNQMFLENLVIAEVKSDKNNPDSNIFELFKAYGIKPSGMSKYCIGLAMQNTKLKQNNFKQKIHDINKIRYNIRY